MKRADASAEPSQRPLGRTVAIVNLTLLVAIAAASLSLLSGPSQYVPAALFAAWCVVVQVMVTRPKTARDRWRRRRWWKNVAIATLSVAVLTVALFLLGGPVYAWLTTI